VSVSVARPSLDEVYLRHTGRQYSAAPENEAPENEAPENTAELAGVSR